MTDSTLSTKIIKNDVKEICSMAIKYGHLNIVLKHYVLERHGEEKWNSILKEASHGGEFNENEKHNDTLTQSLINAAVNILCLKREAFLHLLGEYFLAYLRSNGYDELVRNWGSDILEFAQNLDSVQSFLKSEYQDIVSPSFRCDEDSVSDRMVLHYYSIRPGYQDFIMGFITSAAKTLYQMELNINVLSVSNEEVANENGFREHVVFNIIAKKIVDAMDESTPTFVAQTQKNSERQILKDDVDAVRRKLEQIRKELGEEALPVQKYRSAKAKWKAIAKISLLSRGFVPNYPQLTAVNPKMFIDIFPYHLILDSEMKVYQSGIKIQKMMPSIRSRLATVTEFFTIKYPQCTDLTYDNIKKFIMCPFILEFKKERISKDYTSHHPFQVKGQMFVLIDKGFLFFICSPLVRCWYDLEQRKMKLAEIPIWDATRDFLLTDIATSINTWMMNKAGVPYEGMTGVGSNEALARIQKDLDNERQKNDALYHAFLPRQIANVVRAGQIPEGEYYPEVTALFCDVVHFLNMVRTCKPNDVVGVLNSLYARFDKVTRVHDTFRVESIGDAYFVVAGMPERIPNHAERMANTALGMMYLTQEVASPINGEKLRIRIGMHTGSMVSGVVGRRLPRYIVLGETAVVASKMESHGEPGKIHISPATYRLLKGKGYSMEERGKIELRGIGPIATFFLVGNDNVSEDVLVGRPKVTNQEIKFINEGKQQDPSKNKKANMTPSSGVGSRPPTGDSEIITFSY